MGLFRRKAERASRMNIRPPVPAGDRHGLAIVLIVKDEEKYLPDWLSFHAAAGARHIFIYDNGSTDKTAEIARDFGGCETTVIPWVFSADIVKPAVLLHQQVVSYCHAVSTFGAQFRWMTFIDIDEYLVPKAGISFGDTLHSLDAFTNISLPWVMFGHNGHDIAPEEPLPFAYTARAGEISRPLLNFKCIVDPCDVTQVSVHKFQTRKMGTASVNTLGKIASDYKKRREPDFFTTDGLQLNHYYLMSREELQRKLHRGGVSGVENDRRIAAVTEKAAMIEAAPVKDTAAPDFLLRVGRGSGNSG